MKRKRKSQGSEPDELPDEPIFPERPRAKVNGGDAANNNHAASGEVERKE